MAVMTNTMTAMPAAVPCAPELPYSPIWAAMRVSAFAVARSLAHARGGELSAANSQQGGAVFCLSLQLAQAPAASGQAAGNRSPGAAFEVAPRMALAGWCCPVAALPLLTEDR